ncbi:XdhC family protein [Rhodobacteraceae bacterium]|nr:XdhC family protein [Paracoccaceae bacterium]
MQFKFENLLEVALQWHEKGIGAAVATVIETWGSAPRRVGSQLIVSGDGRMEGSVSGGCVEGAVVLEALDSIKDGKTKVLEYGISDDDAFAVGLACGGKIRVIVEPVGKQLPQELLKELVDAIAKDQSIIYEINIKTLKRRLVYNGYEDRLRKDRSGFKDDGITFLNVYSPKLKMDIVGAVHIAQALVPIAQVVGFSLRIIDPRESFANRERFGSIKISNDFPDVALTETKPNYRTAVILLTHDPKLDDPALHIALQSEAFYIGALGSKKTHKQRKDRLRIAGFTETAIDRVCGPIGLDIGASSPEEISVSILAEVIATLRLVK